MGKKRTEAQRLHDLAAGFKKKAQPIIDRMAKCRDELRALMSDYEDLIQANESEMIDIERAIDTISERI